MKRLVNILLLLPLLMMSCGGDPVSERLDEVDTLAVAEKYDSAYALLSSMAADEIRSDADKAHYYLLRTRLHCVLQKSDTTNVLDDIVIPYYTNTDNKEKLADAYYYKACSELINEKLSEAITNYKRAEDLAASTSNLPLQYKIAESLAYINAISWKPLLQVEYGKKCAKIAQALDKKAWLAHSYHNIAVAYHNLNQEDSFSVYMDKAAQLINYIEDDNKSSFLANLAYSYKHTQPEKAKKYLLEAQKIKERSIILQHLADIYYNEGNKEEYYRLLKKALSINDNSPKDNIIHNLLEYDIEHGKTDSVCKQVNEIIAIKDSIINSLKNDTIKDLQLRFDHQVEMNAANERLIRWQWALGVAVGLVFCMVAFLLWNKYKSKLQLKERQVLINRYIAQMGELESQKMQAEAKIAHLTNDNAMVAELQKRVQESEQAFEAMKRKIADVTDQEVVKVRRGVALYEAIRENQTARHWPADDFEAFIAYYDAINHGLLERIHDDYGKLTPHNIFFLLLKDMGKSKQELSEILGISIDSLRSTESRIRNKKKDTNDIK